MIARETYPWTAGFAAASSGGQPWLIERRREAGAALDELDRLRAEIARHHADAKVGRWVREHLPSLAHHVEVDG